jgi:hypothetical protein
MAALIPEIAERRSQNILASSAKAIRKNIVRHPPKPARNTKTAKANSATPPVISRS